MESSSLCGPQPAFHGPPTAHAPNPTVVISGPFHPKSRLSIIISPYNPQMTQMGADRIHKCHTFLFSIHLAFSAVICAICGSSVLREFRLTFLQEGPDTLLALRSNAQGGDA